MTELAGATVLDQDGDEVQLGDWLEDKGDFSRYAVEGDPEASVWVCTRCETVVYDEDEGCENCDEEV